MASRHFLLVNYDVRRSVPDERIIKVLNRAVDWVQVDPNSWLVWTSRNASTWYERFKPIMNEGDRVLIFGAHVENRAGYMPSAFWNFVRAKLDEKSTAQVK